MSSGEKAKSPATFEERNPFDISKRPGKDVAAEIAQRLAAWKQARARSLAAPTTVPVPEGKLPSQVKAGTAPPIGAPVQPQRLPKSARQSPPQGEASRSAPTVSGARAPFFASFSAGKRAMPPAPRAGDPDGKAAASGAVEIEQAPAETPAFDAPAEAPLGARAAMPEIETWESARTFDAPAAASHAADAAPPAPAIAEALAEQPPIDEDESDAPRADEPRAHEHHADASAPPPADAREIAIDPSHAREAEELNAEAPAADTRLSEHDAPATPVETPEAETRESLDLSGADSIESLDSGEAVRDIEPALCPIITPSPAAVPEMAEIESPLADIRASEGQDADTGGAALPPEAREATEPMMPVVDASDIERDRIAAREIKAKWMRAHELDELAVEMAAAQERQTKSIGAPVAPVPEEPAIEPVEAPLSAEPAREVAQSETAAPAAAALPEADEFARIEPTFDRPMSHAPEPAASPSEPEAAATADAGAATALRGIALPSIETRIERRRFSTLRAEPELAVRHPLFPEIESDGWDVPPAVAARARREPRGGTGWAIGLGAVLLLIGVTAPAAIWQGQRSAQIDQVALLATALPPANATGQATLSEPPQPVTAPTPSSAQPTATDQARADQSSLGALRDGGEVTVSPISKPPVPRLETASKPAAQLEVASTGASVVFPPVARPFVPEGQPSPFVMAPGTGAPAASVALRPKLMAQLKPKAPAGMLSAPAAKPAATAARKVAQKPQSRSPQSLDQMFQTLIDTLSEGQPVNPANKPASPSTRR